MLIFYSDGRLGNQLFQYAFLRNFAKKGELIICFDMIALTRGFDINNKKFVNIETGKYFRFFFEKIIKKIFLYALIRLKIIGIIKQDRIKDDFLNSVTFKKGIFPINYVENGFFQSDAFFESEEIDFQIKKNYIEKANIFLQKIPDTYEKVFVHVRRGDYLVENYAGFKGINLPAKYYMDAIKIINKEVVKPFYIFLSDDPEYVQACFTNIENKIISDNDMMIDFAIMSLCQYGVVSNSSFSWWGSYFMENKKKVIFPKYWYGWKRKINSHLGIHPAWGTEIDF